MTAWQVELGAKDVQGSARLSKCLLNNAEVPQGKRGENIKAPPTTTKHPHTHTHSFEVDLVELFMQRGVVAVGCLERLPSDGSAGCTGNTQSHVSWH